MNVADRTVTPRTTRAPRMGLCAGMLHELPMQEFVALAARHCFASVMFAPGQWSGIESAPRGTTRKMLEANGITVRSIDGVMAGLPGLADAVQPFLLEEDDYFRFADEVGASCFNVPHWQGDPRTSIAAFAERLGPFAERAAKQGISLGLEFLPGTGIPDLATANRISEAVGLANVGVTIDTWHLARSRGTVADIRALPAGRIKAFQISDRAADEDSKPDEEMWGRLLPGEGALPLRNTIEAVRLNAPDIGIDAESFSKELLHLSDEEIAARVARTLLPLIV